VDRAVEVPELDRLAIEEAVEVEAAVAAAVAPLGPGVAVAVPRAVERLHCGRLAPREARHELWIDRLAILPEAPTRDLKDVLEQPLLLVDEVDQVEEVADVELTAIDVDVNSGRIVSAC